MKILTVNPGSTSTKIAVYENEKEIFSLNVAVDKDVVTNLDSVIEELPYRKESIIEALNKNNYKLEDFDAFSGRGGPLKPLKAGIYQVDENMYNEVKAGKVMTMHASVLGCLIVFEFSKKTSKPAFIVDPISTDEMMPLAKITGHPEIKKQALTHALNVRASARKTCKMIGKDFTEANFIVVHLGGGISVNAVEKGKIIDVLESRQTGPFAPTSCGDLPIKQFMKWFKNSDYPIDKIPELFNKKGGLLYYFGTDNVKELMERTKDEPKVKEVLEAMTFNIAKTVLALHAPLKMKVDRVIFTGGIAHSDELVSWITKWFDGRLEIMKIPGESEMEALALGALRGLKKEEEILKY